MWVKFLDEVLRTPDERKALMEMIGYSFMPTSKRERYVILKGAGANGKSVVLRLVTELVGRAAVTTVPLSKLDEASYVDMLAGKLVMLVPEMGEHDFSKDASLKALVSGDLMIAAAKYARQYTFHPFATVWASVNVMPHSRDTSVATARRQLVLPMLTNFERDERRDVDLSKKLMAELPGIMRMALEAYADVILSGRFTNPASSLELIEEQREIDDPVTDWWRNCCQLVDGGLKVVKSKMPTVAEMYDSYTMYCKNTGIKHNVAGRTKLMARLRQAPFGVSFGVTNRGVTALNLTLILGDFE
jgi:putative DNA primase/helicase